MSKLLALFLLFNSSILGDVLQIDLQDRRPEVYQKDGKNFGPVVEIAKDLMKTSGHIPDFHWIPWVRSLSKAKSGESVLLARHSITNERREFLLPIPYGFEIRRVFFFKNKKSKFNIEKYEDLLGHSIGLRNGSYYSPRFSSDDNLNKVKVKKDTLLIGMLQRERIDLVVSNSIIQFKEKVKAAGLNYDKDFEPVKFKDTFPNGRYFSVPKKSKYAKYYKELSCAMYKLRKSGKISYYFKKHGLQQLVQTYNDVDSTYQKGACKNQALKK
jgi:polar amino acid transport system substrate-binding protein